MDNKLKSKTRLAAIQILAQQLINNHDIEIVKEDFDKHYRNTSIDESSTATFKVLPVPAKTAVFK